MSLFIGREIEMDHLRDLLKKRSSSLIVMKGWRRIGKSRLLQEFGKEVERTLDFKHFCRSRNDVY